MSRWLTVFGILGVATAGILAFVIGLPQSSPDTSSDEGSARPAVRPALAAQRAQPMAPSAPIVEVHNMPGVAGPLVIPGCRLVVKNRQEVPALRDGQLLFYGTEAAPGEVLPKSKLIEVDMGFVVTLIKPGEEVPPDQIVAVPGDNLEIKLYRRVQEGEVLDPNSLSILKQRKRYKRLDLGDKVKEGQLLALVDPRLALDDLGQKWSRVIAAVADRDASAKTRDEAENRYQRELRLYDRKGSSPEQVDGARLTFERYFFEEISKRQAIFLCMHELKQAQTILEMHAIRSKIGGEIKAIYKNRGDAVRNLDPVLMIMDSERLKIEGMVDLQHAQHLRAGDDVVVEPSKVEKPELVLRGHLQEVTSVAVSMGKRPLILSGSEDRTVRVWDREDGKQLFTLRFQKPIRAVACTAGGDDNLAVVGVADGSAWLLRGLGPTTPPKAEALPGTHKGAVNCAAFSPDGKLVATGGEDHVIRLYDTSDGSLKHVCPADQGHRGTLTSLHFASNTMLVSAGRGDNTVIVWTLGASGTPTVAHSFPRRSGDVADLGVSPDGKRLLFDQGKDLQLLSLDPQHMGHIDGVLHNLSAAIHFTTMALFSPGEGKLILTASASENRLQLYRAPIGDARGAEIRQLMWPAAPATCGAFDPNGRFIVTGMRDRNVLVWQMPSDAELKQDVLKAKLTLVERSLDSSTRQVRIAAEVDNPVLKDRDGKERTLLLPGDTATLVIDPKK